MTTTLSPYAEHGETFSPITLNGEPVITWRMTHLIEVDERLFEQEYAASSECSCRRCLLHEDFGGCLVADAMYGFVEFLAGLS